MVGVLEAIRRRRSIRRYKAKDLPQEYLDKILEAGRLAPSAGNRQPWSFVVVTDPELRRRVAEVARHQMFMADAGAIVVGCGHPDVSPRWYRVDVTIALQNIVLTATDLGLGSCWIGAFDEEEVRGVLGIPDDVRVLAMISIGYPDESPTQRPRKALSEIVHYNGW